MATLIEQAKKAADRKIKVAEEAKAKSLQERMAASRERKIKLEMERQTAWLIGTTVRDLAKAGKLTPQQHVELGNILALREDKPKDWGLLAEFLPAPTAKASPISRHPAERDAAQ